VKKTYYLTNFWEPSGIDTETGLFYLSEQAKWGIAANQGYGSQHFVAYVRPCLAGTSNLVFSYELGYIPVSFPALKPEKRPSLILYTMHGATCGFYFIKIGL
jgi:hypothetical protein